RAGSEAGLEECPEAVDRIPRRRKQLPRIPAGTRLRLGPSCHRKSGHNRLHQNTCQRASRLSRHGSLNRPRLELGKMRELASGALAAVDWGTTRVRAMLLAGDGSVVAETESDKGIGTLSGGHEDVFDALVEGWPKVPAILAGMVGSRQGWREAPYV